VERTDVDTAGNRLLAELRERAKELSCLYEVEELLGRADLGLEETLQQLVERITPGWQYPDVCKAVIMYGPLVFSSGDVEPTPWVLLSDIEVQGEVVGQLAIYYTEPRPAADVGPFLGEEVRLAKTIAERLGHYIMFQRLRDMRADLEAAQSEQATDRQAMWRATIHLLRQSDEVLYLRIARKLLNHLCSIGIPEAQVMLHDVEQWVQEVEDVSGEVNVPGRRTRPRYAPLMTDRLFEIAARALGDDEIMGLVQRWMQQDRATFFSKIIDNPRSSLNEIADALRRFSVVMAGGVDLAPSTRRSFRVSLARRILTEQVEFVKVAKEYLRIGDFVALLDDLIVPPGSYGRLGGKSAGLLLAAKVLERTQSEERPVGTIRVPRTWYIPSNGLLDFVVHNDLEDVIEQKFKEVAQIRAEYPNIVQLFKNSTFPPDSVRGISLLLDEAGEVPLIVRSSSLLEDRLGTAFSGKYKSLFVANQGDKATRLDALLDAIAEVYASTFSPDPIEYRRERGLLEFYEEMGILIQEVVGVRAGRYFLPSFAGVAFSNNEFRWSPRIRRKDGLLRMVPGLGTRAVDRVPDDYPILIAPGQPNLRVNVALDEVIRYSPSKLDVINLEARTVETVSLQALLREIGTDYPGLDKVVQVLRGDMLQRPVRLLFDAEKDDVVATFDGLLTDTPFVQHMANILAVLEEHLGTPVDVEFAHDGTDFYLLQCRPQSPADDVAPAPIPKDVPLGDIVFTANRYVSNGWLPDITHIVYVDPDAYAVLGTREEMLDVARAVGRLNKLLPKRRFVLMGPGRWGSREISLGVGVTYADISNTAMLVEIARQRGQYMPDVSFGTHFFQDLVEARIRYLPLYPDDEGVVFNERFLRSAPNLLSEMLPEFGALAHAVHVIDVPAVAGGRRMRVLLNADLGEALGMLTAEDEQTERGGRTAPRRQAPPAESYWRWRHDMAERIAASLDAERMGVQAMYLFGSTKNATAGPGSDVDLLVHFRGAEEQREALLTWLEGWSLAMAEMNYLRTGYRTRGLLDVHLVTDEDIARGTSYAAKIDAVTDPARELPLGRPTEPAAGQD